MDLQGLKPPEKILEHPTGVFILKPSPVRFPSDMPHDFAYSFVVSPAAYTLGNTVAAWNTWPVCHEGTGTQKYPLLIQPSY